MTHDIEYTERRRAEMAENDLLHEKIRHLETMATATSQSLTDHVTTCARIQKWGLVVGTGTFMWLVGHSVEAEKLIGKIISAVVP